MTTFTPREIKNRKFKQSLMGVDADEVKSFLKIVATEFDKILTQNAQLEKRLTEQTVRKPSGKPQSSGARPSGRPRRRPGGKRP
jgi:DivIVA domain-containing protein